MKISKKWLTLLLAIASTICLVFGLAACKTEKEPEGEIELSAPVVVLNGNVISWEPVANASYYIVYEGEAPTGTNVTGTTYTINKTIEGVYTFYVAAYNSKADPKVGPKSEPVVYTVNGEDPGPGPGPGPGPDDPTDETKLLAPLADIEGNALNWYPVSDAVSYDIYKNGEKVDSVESFDFLGDPILPSTYTILSAEDGDKFQVVAVSGDENVADSDLSEEVEYTALTGTLSLKNSVYITNATKNVPITADEPGKLYKVSIKANNNLAITAGSSGTSSIAVQGSPSDDSNPYGASATYEDGVWSATIVITGDNTLYFAINTSFQGVSLGYTVSLSDPYEVEEGADANVVQTYTLNSTGSVDVVIPYNIGGYRIKIQLGDDVPETGNVLYAVLEDGSTSKTIYVQIGSVTSPMTAMEGYYVSSSFASEIGALYLSSSTVDLKATISIEVPDVVYANVPELEVDSPVYSLDISNKQASPTMFKVNNVENGEYFLLAHANTTGLRFYAQVDDGGYTALTAVANIYSIKITIDDSRFLYMYGTDVEMLYVNYIALYKAENHVYNLDSQGEKEDALLGNSVETATEFNLSNAEQGDYTLTITGSASGLTFKVIVGEQTYTISSSVNNYPKFIYTTEIKIEDETSISIYLTDGIYIANITLTKIEELPLPELKVGAENGQKFSLVRYTNDSYTFSIANVAPGNYKLALTGFNQSQWEDYINLTVKVGSKSVQLCDNGSGYKGEQKIVIAEGDTELVISSNSNPNITWTIYLLAEDESLGGGDDEELTSLTVSKDFEPAMYEGIDISKLVAGTYSISIANNANMTSGPTYDLCFDLDSGEVFSTDNKYPYASGEITIPEGATTLYIRLNGAIRNGSTAKLEITLELKGEVGSGGSETSFSTSVSTRYYGWVEIDISSLQYGAYTVKISGEGVAPDILGNYNSFSISTVDGGGNDETGLNNGNSYTCTNFNISSGKLYLWASDATTITITLTLVS